MKESATDEAHGHGYGGKEVPLTAFQSRQIDCIDWLQHRLGRSGKSTAARVLRVVSFCGTGRVLYPACAVVGWFADATVGRDLLRGLVLVLLVMSACKTFFAMPRPFFLTKRVRHLDPTLELSFGFPSGHTMATTVLYGYMAYKFGGPWVRGGVAVFVALTMLSRVYTAAHFIVDVVAGVALGLSILTLMIVQDGMAWAGPAVLLPIGLVLLCVVLTVRDESGRVRIKRVSEGYQGSSMALGLGVGALLRRTEGYECRSATAPLPSSAAILIGIAGTVLLVLFEERVLMPAVRDAKKRQSTAGTIVGVIVEAVKHTWVIWGINCLLPLALAAGPAAALSSLAAAVGVRA